MATTGNLTMNNLSIEGSLDVACNLSIVGSLDVACNLSIEGSLDVACNLSIEGSLDVGCNLTVKGVSVVKDDFTRTIEDIFSISVKDIYGMTSNGSTYHIVVPPNFSGTVAMYSHGYRFPFPSTDPVVNLFENYPEVIYLPQPTPLPTRGHFSNVVRFLLDREVAVMGAGFAIEGWNVDSAVETNRELLDIFKGLYPQTNKVIIWGDSLGGIITQKFAELYPNEVDAVGLFDAADNIISELSMAGDVLWGIKSIFDSSIQINNFSSNYETRVQEVNTTIRKVLNVMLPMALNPADGYNWDLMPQPLTSNGVALSNAGNYPVLAIHAIGAMAGIPNRSAHFGGALDLSNITTNMYIYGTLENVFNACLLAINATADLEGQLNGPVYDNTTVNYLNRLDKIEASQFSYVNTDPTEYLTILLSSLNTFTRAVGPCNVKLLDGTLSQINYRVTKPTYCITADADPITPTANVRRYYDQYSSNVSIGLSTSNMFQILISPAPTTYYIKPQTDKPVLGTSHANYTQNNYIMGASLMLYSANTGKLLTGSKLADIIKYTDNMVDGSNIITNFHQPFYYIN